MDRIEAVKVVSRFHPNLATLGSYWSNWNNMCIYIYMVESVVFGVSDDLRVALTPRPTSFLSLPLSLSRFDANLYSPSWRYANRTP